MKQKNLNDKSACFSSLVIAISLHLHHVLFYSVCHIVQAFLDRFEALPAIKTYMSSSEFIKWPINNKIAKWYGGASP